MLTDGWTDMAAAIIELAALDYRASRAGLTVDTKNAMINIDHRFIADECRQFFLSEWFGILSMSSMDGEELLKLLDEDVKRGWKKPKDRKRGSFL